MKRASIAIVLAFCFVSTAAFAQDRAARTVQAEATSQPTSRPTTQPTEERADEEEEAVLQETEANSAAFINPTFESAPDAMQNAAGQ